MTRALSRQETEEASLPSQWLNSLTYNFTGLSSRHVSICICLRISLTISCFNKTSKMPRLALIVLSTFNLKPASAYLRQILLASKIQVLNLKCIQQTVDTLF